MRCVVHQASSATVSTAGAAKACIAPFLRMVRRQRVQTFRRIGRPSTITRRGCTLGAQVRLLLRLDHGNGAESLYRGLKQVSVTNGTRVRKGAALGLAGGRIPYEGEGHVCVSLLENGTAIPFELDERNQ